LKGIALDAATTVRPAAEVVEAMVRFLRDRHAIPDPSSARGRFALEATERARRAVGRLLGVEPERVVFTSGLVESNNTALRGAARLARKAGRLRIVVAAHGPPSFLHPARSLAREGFEVDFLPAGRKGRISVSDLPKDELAVLALEWIHPELGTLEPIRGAVRRARRSGGFALVDVSLAFGRFRFDLRDLGEPDFLTFDFHRMGGPLGVGAIAMREDLPLPPLLEGGTEERGFRPGLLDLAAIVGAGVASELARKTLPARERRLRDLGRRLARRILSIPGVRLVGPGPAERLPGHLTLLVEGVRAEPLALALESRGIRSTTPAVCSEETGLPSAVLRACGYGREEIESMLVVCLSPIGGETGRDVDRAAEALREEIERLRRVAGEMAGRTPRGYTRSPRGRRDGSRTSRTSGTGKHLR